MCVLVMLLASSSVHVRNMHSTRPDRDTLEFVFKVVDLHGAWCAGTRAAFEKALLEKTVRALRVSAEGRVNCSCEEVHYEGFVTCVTASVLVCVTFASASVLVCVNHHDRKLRNKNHRSSFGVLSLLQVQSMVGPRLQMPRA